MGTHKTAATEWRGFWFLPVVAALGYATSVIHVYSIGPFIAPLQQEFGWSRAQISLGLTVASFVGALFCIPIGIFVDRIGPRRIGLIGVLAMCAAFALLGTATGTMTNWALLYLVVALATLGVQATVWTSAVNSRFERSRGLALAITLSGASISAAIFPILATWLIGAYGWRTAFVGMAGIWVALVFPFVFLFFRGAQDQGLPARTATPDVTRAPTTLTGVSLSEGLRSPTLYKLLVAAGLFAFTAVGAVVHFVPILTDSGATPLGAAGIASLIGIFSIIGRLGTGLLLDRFPAQNVGATVFLLPVVGVTLLLLDGSNPFNQSLAAATLGLTLGAEVDVIAYLAAKHFGLKNFGALYGAMVMALALGAAFGPLTAGAVFDRYGSYAPFLLLDTVLMAASAITLFSLRPAPLQAAAPVQAT
ncbi:MAG: MFS transporter [Sinimarinibacterium sp.]|jgi:MFS family permease